MSRSTAIRISAIAGFLAVALGAFGAHGLEKALQQNNRVDTWETAVFYHFIHAVMLYLLAASPSFRKGAWWSFLIGILIFSGTLYALCLTNIRWLGAITPIGGLSFMAGWILLVSKPPSGGASA
jgi:uncharacterized membrane protein YgdD (TMEM256/DUF423 family)